MLFLTKLIGGLASLPTACILGLLLSRAVSAHRLLSRVMFAVSLAVLWLAATPPMAQLVTYSLERQYPERAISSLPNLDIAIVLGGAVRPAQSPRQGIELGEAGNRVLYAAQLYKAGKVKQILAVGGRLPWETHLTSEADDMTQVLLELGVPTSAIQQEHESQTTHENAERSAAILAHGGFHSGFLVTSALHMPRAILEFRHTVIDLQPASTDVNVTWPLIDSPLDLLPSAAALDLTNRSLHEYLGLLAATVRGR
jgi:uncharacterized SAM-binding protein YcdF (DUF218 family)